MYKDPKAYKGFEAWFHALQMSAKMYVYTFLIVLVIHLSIPLLYMILFRTDILTMVLQVFLGFHVQLWPKAFKVLFNYGLWIFILATPVWLLYPVLLKKFKSKSESIMQDKHLRGTRLISDDELREIVLQDIKKHLRR